MFITISVLLAVVCLLPAAGKLTGQPKMRKSAAHFGIPWPRYRLIGVAELAAAAGILAGLWWHPLGVAAAAGMALWLACALAVRNQRILAAWNTHQEDNARRAAAGLPPKTRRRRRASLATLAAGPP